MPVPAGPVGHQNSYQHAGCQRATNHTTQCFGTKEETDQQGSNDCHNARQNHFVQGSSSRDIYTFTIVSFSFAFQQLSLIHI